MESLLQNQTTISPISYINVDSGSQCNRRAGESSLIVGLSIFISSRLNLSCELDEFQRTILAGLRSGGFLHQYPCFLLYSRGDQNWRLWKAVEARFPQG